MLKGCSVASNIMLGVFVVMFPGLTIVFLLMFMGQGTQSGIRKSIPVLAFSIISAVAAAFMLISYMLYGLKYRPFPVGKIFFSYSYVIVPTNKIHCVVII
ncbi:hypothetical protein D3C81_629580 [compost metagenome]